MLFYGEFKQIIANKDRKEHTKQRMYWSFLPLVCVYVSS